MNKCLLLIFSILFMSCKNDSLPKPKAFLALEYPAAQYNEFNRDCPFTFEKNQISNFKEARGNNPCWFNLHYPLLDATIFITYQEVNHNLDSLLMDAQKMPLQHTIKADYIEGDVYTNPDRRIFGMLYEVEGNAASQAQFYVTDSTRHFITGSLYFNQKPNYDSIMPAASYLKNDIKHIMETLHWKN